MATLEDEIKELKERNNELVQKVQYWKITAAQRGDEKLELMKEINELRLKLSRIRSGGAAQARKLDTALQSASEEALSHLVQASSAVARTMELAKAYMRDRQELDMASPRWSNISGTPSTEKVHRVPPMLMGGRSIQPVVSLSRTTFNPNNSRSSSRSPNRNITERALPMHMLQDVYIPLTRIDMADFPGAENGDEENIEESTEDLALEDEAGTALEESQNLSDSNEFDALHRLDVVVEEMEPVDGMVTPPRTRMENPLEGPSWLLDVPKAKSSRPRNKVNHEPDSTTELDEGGREEPPPTERDVELECTLAVHEFTPTVRRRKRTSPPPTPMLAPSPTPTPTPPSQLSPRPSPRLNCLKSRNGGRVLKVLVPKMRLEEDPSAGAGGDAGDAGDDGEGVGEGVPGAGEASPPKRAMRFDAPSPNGATDAGVIVLEATRDQFKTRGSNESSTVVPPEERGRRDRSGSRDGLDRDSSDSSGGGGNGRVSEGRTRRPRKAVTYKEKPLNRKLRR